MKYILMAVIIIPFLSFCFVSANNFILDKKHRSGISLKSIYTLCALVGVIASALSYIANLGFTRLVMAIPIYLHTILFFFVVYGTSSLAKKSKWLKVSILVGLISFPTANILLPDNLGYGYDYAFFGLVADQNATSVMSIVAKISYAINIIALATQIVLFFIAKKQQKKTSCQ